MKIDHPLKQEIISTARSQGVRQRDFGVLLQGAGSADLAHEIARAAGRDLYHVDLRQVVSRDIGETEKNLDRAFEQAAAKHAVLFFDEADALFGKRSEVKDAHDRYLLKKIEEYEGITILATNQCQNVDEAFGRHLRFIIDLEK